jgi:TfoX/Sxy family transcriptional regulator of competence genes
MAYDEELAGRVRAALDDEPAYAERKMFGGIAFMLGGNMCCGVINDELMVRVVHDDYAALLKRPHAREMDFTGRPMKGYLFVAAAGCAKAAALQSWLDIAVRHARMLPPKLKPKPTPTPKPRKRK